jgi:hypothetical protein
MILSKSWIFPKSDANIPIPHPTPQSYIFFYSRLASLPAASLSSQPHKIITTSLKFQKNRFNGKYQANIIAITAMDEQYWNALFESEFSNAGGGTTQIKNVTLKKLPGRSPRQESVGYYDASELGSPTKISPRKTTHESDADILLSRSERRRPRRRSSKSRDDEELSRSLQHHCPPRSPASKTRVEIMGDYFPTDILEEDEFNLLNASQIFEFEKQGQEEEDAFGRTIIVASTTTSYFQKSLEKSPVRFKDNSSKLEYEEPGDMTFGSKKEPTRSRSLDVGGGDESKSGSRHDDLPVGPPKRSRRTPRRSSMGAHPSKSMPGSIRKEQHTTATYGADSLVVSTAAVNAHQQSSSKSRTRRGNTMTMAMTGYTSSTERHEQRKSFEDKRSHHRNNTSSGSSNLNACRLGIQTDFSPMKASGDRSAYNTSVTTPTKEARNNSSKARRRNSTHGRYVEERHGALSNNHYVSEKHEPKEHRPCRIRSGSPTHHRTRVTHRSSVATCSTTSYSSEDSHDSSMYGCVPPIKAHATEQEKTQKVSRHTSIGSSASSPESHDNTRSGAFPAPHRMSRNRRCSSMGDANRAATAGLETVRPKRRVTRRSSTGYGETILAATTSSKNRGPATNVADTDLSIFDLPSTLPPESKIDFDRMQMLAGELKRIRSV